MDIKLKAHRKGERGFLCMPLVKHLPSDVQRKHPDWKTVSCPICRTACYESAAMKETLEREPQLMPVCTMCAIKWGDVYD